MPLETTTPKPTPVPVSRCTNHPPTSPQLNSLDRRRRRPSTRCSFSSAGRSASFSSQHSEIHRTLCAQDHDSFSYDTNHLKEWYMPVDLWEKLSLNLQESISTLQNAGAAALTGFERLEVLRNDLVKETDVDEGVHVSSKLTNLSVSPDHESAYSDQEDSEILLVNTGTKKFTPTQSHADRTRSDSVFSASPLALAPTLITSLSPSPPASGSSTPLTPMSPLSKPAHTFPARSPSPCMTSSFHSAFGTGYQSPAYTSPERSFHLPLQPLTAYYHAELVQLKKETLVRLRHAVRKVDVEMRCEEVDDKVTSWWAAMKDKAEKLEHNGCLLSAGI